MTRGAAAGEGSDAEAQGRSTSPAPRPSPQTSVSLTRGVRHRVALHEVAKDQTSAIVIAARGGGVPAWSGTGDWDYVCGSCTALLCAGLMSERRFPSLVFRCVCGVLNRSS